MQVNYPKLGVWINTLIIGFIIKKMIYNPAMLEKPTISRNRSKSTYNKTTYYHKLIWTWNKTCNQNRFNTVLKHDKYTQVLT